MVAIEAVAARVEVATAGNYEVGARAHLGLMRLLPGPVHCSTERRTNSLVWFASWFRSECCSCAEAESMEKRQRERARREKQQQKEQRRVERAAERQKRAREGSKGADLEGMVPGPQPGQIVDLP